MPTKTRPIPALTIEDQERFWSKVDRRGPDDCWEWTAGKGSQGYGHFCIQGTDFRTNRVAYFISSQFDPGDLHVLHSCDNPGCCNPDHLWLGTNRDNVLDCRQKGRNVCRRGEDHPLTPLEERDVLEILVSSKSQGELARQFHVSQPTISNIQRGLTWAEFHPELKRSTRPCYGEDCAVARLRVEDVRAIRASPESNTVLAERYGVSSATIYCILNYQTWKHVA